MKRERDGETWRERIARARARARQKAPRAPKAPKLPIPVVVWIEALEPRSPFSTRWTPGAQLGTFVRRDRVSRWLLTDEDNRIALFASAEDALRAVALALPAWPAALRGVTKVSLLPRHLVPLFGRVR
jgi:hypothetical protein